jgi:hypothetical protein
MNRTLEQTRNRLSGTMQFYQDNRVLMRVLVLALLALLFTAIYSPYSLFGF